MILFISVGALHDGLCSLCCAHTLSRSLYASHTLFHPSLPQTVKVECCRYVAEGDVALLPLDIVGGSAGVEAAARFACCEAFGGRGVDYVVRGLLTWRLQKTDLVTHGSAC